MGQTERPVIICTGHRGVYFGYATDTTGPRVSLKRARNAHYWKCTEGIFELGSTGPLKGSKIGARADIEVGPITTVIECTEEATAAWEAAAWG